MKNPIGKFKREKLEEIRKQAVQANVNFNLLSEKLVELGLFTDGVNQFMADMKPVIEFVEFNMQMYQKKSRRNNKRNR